MARSRVGVDGVVHLHLQDQVRAALEVEPQVDALLQCGQQAGRRKALGNAKDAEQEEDQHRDNNEDFCCEVLVHE